MNDWLNFKERERGGIYSTINNHKRKSSNNNNNKYIHLNIQITIARIY